MHPFGAMIDLRDEYVRIGERITIKSQYKAVNTMVLIY